MTIRLINEHYTRHLRQLMDMDRRQMHSFWTTQKSNMLETKHERRHMVQTHHITSQNTTSNVQLHAIIHSRLHNNSTIHTKRTHTRRNSADTTLRTYICTNIRCTHTHKTNTSHMGRHQHHHEHTSHSRTQITLFCHHNHYQNWTTSMVYDHRNIHDTQQHTNTKKYTRIRSQEN